ncbi:MAG: YdeI/OmpD-associated family protein [Chloroflexi bacterium]|nr:YdeI/OmpD-associated family protein [Chloroflexota bacterium]
MPVQWTSNGCGTSAWTTCGTIPVMDTRKEAERVPADSAEEWAAWLAANHTRTTGVWLVTWRAASGRPVLGYEGSVIEALRFGWIDSTGGSVDAERTELWFAPRKRGSGWARTNKRRIERLETEGRMEAPGRRLLDAAKADGSWTLLDDVEELIVPDDLAAAFAAFPGSLANWESFPPSARRGILEWIVQAKRPESRAKRIDETARQAQLGKRANEWVPRDKRL